MACGLKCGVNQAGPNPATLQNLNQNDQGEAENGPINDRPAAVPAVVFRLPKAFADGADAGKRAWLLQALALEALEQQLAWLLGSCQSQGDPAPPQVPQPSLAAPTTYSP